MNKAEETKFQITIEPLEYGNVMKLARFLEICGIPYGMCTINPIFDNLPQKAGDSIEEGENS